MQIKLFTIPVGDSGGMLDEMNRFLSGNKILEVENQLISNVHGAYWCFCVRYIERNSRSAGYSTAKKIDYKEVLEEETFKKFASLRETRKKVAAEQGVPAFAVFTDEELAGLAKLSVITAGSMLNVKGIGDKKIARYSKYFIDKKQDNETTGSVD